MSTNRIHQSTVKISALVVLGIISFSDCFSRRTFNPLKRNSLTSLNGVTFEKPAIQVGEDIPEEVYN